MTAQKENIIFSKVGIKILSPKKIEFPSISCLITETLPPITLTRPLVYVMLFSFIMCSAIAVVLHDIRMNQKKLSLLQQKREEVIKKIAYWETTVRKYKDYRDGYYQLALLAYQLGNTEDAKVYIQQTLAIDPQFYQAQYLLDEIEK